MDEFILDGFILAELLKIKQLLDMIDMIEKNQQLIDEMEIKSNINIEMEG